MTTLTNIIALIHQAKNVFFNLSFVMHNLLIIFTLISFNSHSQNPNRKYISHEITPTGIEIQVNDGKYIISYYTEKIVETTFIPQGEIYQKESHAIIKNYKKLKLKSNHSSNLIRFFSEHYMFDKQDMGNIQSEIEIHLYLSPFKLAFHSNGKEITSEKSGYFKTDEFESIEFNLIDVEILYGGGARALGMNRRGNRLQLYNRANYGYETHSELMNFTMPIVISSNKYMIHFDNASTGYLDLDSKKDNTLKYETTSGRKTYQIIVGNSWKELIKNYTELTGRQPLPPRWALGNFSSRFGYHSQAEVMNTIAAFKRDSIPVDAIILDLYWFGKEILGTMGNLEFFRDSFPDPQKMINDLKAQGVKTVLITEPFILTTSSKWNEAVEKKILATDNLGNPFKYDFYFGNTGLIDIYKTSANQWFWDIYKNLKNMGVAGFWGDLGEPEVHPEALLHKYGLANEVHNIYGHDWARLISDGYKRDFPNERPFILMRAGYSGSQKFGMIPWSGDVNRTWGGLRSQTEISLQMGIQGMAYMHSDLGGFAGNNDEPELYVRWLQYGVFNPVFRPHAQEDVASEPVFKDANTKRLAKKAIELRYQLLPYNYSLAYENSTKGLPLMRPMFFEEEDNEKLLTIEDQYLWGNNLLVAPVFEKGQQTREVYFPKNNSWFDFYTGQKHEAGTTATVNLTMENIPVFVRGGAFIPMVKTVQTTDNYNLKQVDVHFYFDEKTLKSESRVYNDDGISANVENKWQVLIFKSELTKKELIITLSDFEFYDNFQNKVNLIIHNVSSLPKKITNNGDRVRNYVFDKETKTLKLNLLEKEFIQLGIIKLKF
jgi:alpha-glucosidase (family GH31 glycosyl hydrolase)